MCVCVYVCVCVCVRASTPQHGLHATIAQLSHPLKGVKIVILVCTSLCKVCSQRQY